MRACGLVGPRNRGPHRVIGRHKEPGLAEPQAVGHGRVQPHEQLCVLMVEAAQVHEVALLPEQHLRVGAGAHLELAALEIRDTALDAHERAKLLTRQGGQRQVRGVASARGLDLCHDDLRRAPRVATAGERSPACGTWRAASAGSERAGGGQPPRTGSTNCGTAMLRARSFCAAETLTALAARSSLRRGPALSERRRAGPSELASSCCE